MARLILIEHYSRDAERSLPYDSPEIHPRAGLASSSLAVPLNLVVKANGQTGINDHYLTTDSGKAGYTPPFIVARIFATQQPSTVPLYGSFNRTQGQHWYTINESEQKQKLADGSLDGYIVGFVYDKQLGGSTPLWRYWRGDGATWSAYDMPTCRTNACNWDGRSGPVAYVFKGVGATTSAAPVGGRP